MTKMGRQRWMANSRKRTGPQEFMRVGILHAVAQFIACDNQVSLRNAELQDLLSAEGLLVISCC